MASEDKPMTSAEETPGERLDRLRARLSVQQREFVELYLADLDVGEAYSKAFDMKTARAARARGFALLDKWYIQDYIAAMFESNDSRDALVTKSEVITVLRDIMRGDVTTEDKDRIAAAALLGKYLGLDIKRVAAVTPDGKAAPVPVFVGLTDRQVLEIRSKILGVDTTSTESDDSNA